MKNLLTRLSDSILVQQILIWEAFKCSFGGHANVYSSWGKNKWKVKEQTLAAEVEQLILIDNLAEASRDQLNDLKNKQNESWLSGKSSANKLQL